MFFFLAPANSRASSRGNTGGASVTPNDWALSVRRLQHLFSIKKQLLFGCVENLNFIVAREV